MALNSPSEVKKCQTFLKMFLSVQVNCISTEFTPKKHGGEKGVPFRIQVETYLQGDKIAWRHVHTASCQIKVFKVTSVVMIMYVCPNK